jgi:hypothetical protein
MKRSNANIIKLGECRCFVISETTYITAPSTRALYEPGTATMCYPSVVHGLRLGPGRWARDKSKRSSGACSAHTSPISP